ncbi:MAG: putative molybdenum carrier protein [Gammaproteobacteria bacterium]|nr:putative molybdenum carrier protein [Gammaproteobacteria bacterium]MDH3508310.1 putative molybdenum carrier protein [Gammaproteobacteria bacterium]
MLALEKIVSGGQTGADRAALDVAMGLELETGGWVPHGRRAEDGRIPVRYAGLIETDTESYQRRTALNVRDSDATLIFSFGEATGGTALSLRLAQSSGKPVLAVDLESLSAQDAAGLIRAWLTDTGVRVLNVAGPRESGEPRITAAVTGVLKAALSAAES